MLNKFLFKFDPELIHNLVMKFLKYTKTMKLYPKPQNNVKRVLNIDFPNILGIAAGFDKNAEYIEVLNDMGFGFIEIGTATPIPQSGNIKPRIFRNVENHSITNRMGFPNIGIDKIVNNIKNSNYKGILGINIGKNKNTENKDAINDYLYCIDKAHKYASYFTINISSPNTPNLRELQFGSDFIDIIEKIKSKQFSLEKYIPLFIKISPDLTKKQVQEMSWKLLEYEIDGIICTNTTRSVEGGISGFPLKDKSSSIIREFKKHVHNKIVIIGCGGISSLSDAKEKIEAGADLLQIYTGLIYKGPKIIREIMNNIG